MQVTIGFGSDAGGGEADEESGERTQGAVMVRGRLLVLRAAQSRIGGDPQAARTAHPDVVRGQSCAA